MNLLKSNPQKESRPIIYRKKKGRVGDSPIAGAGLFADNNLGKYVS